MMKLILSISLYPLLALFSLGLTVLARLGVNWWVPLFANQQDNLPCKAIHAY